jgi:alanine racemase
MCQLDITHIPNVSIGDEVVIVGQQNGEQITIEEIAKRNKTISTDVIFQISNRIPKFYKEIL